MLQVNKTQVLGGIIEYAIPAGMWGSPQLLKLVDAAHIVGSLISEAGASLTSYRKIEIGQLDALPHSRRALKNSRIESRPDNPASTEPWERKNQ